MAQSAGRVGFLLKGEYSKEATYTFLDVVNHNGGSYAAKKAVSGIDPPNDEYWQILTENSEYFSVKNGKLCIVYDNGKQEE